MDTDPGGTFVGEGTTHFPWDTVSKIDVDSERRESLDTHFARRYWPVSSVDENSHLVFEERVRLLDTTTILAVFQTGFANSGDTENNANMIVIYHYHLSISRWAIGAYIYDDLGQVDSGIATMIYDTYKNVWLIIRAEYINKKLTVMVYDTSDTPIIKTSATLTPGRTLSMNSYALMSYWGVPQANRFFKADLKGIIASTEPPLPIRSSIIKDTVVKA